MEQLFDLHVHSCHSIDCETPLADIFERARRRGLSGVAITDHDSFGGSAEALALAPKDLLIVPGAELSTEYGHILCYFLRCDPREAGLRKGKDGFFPFAEVRAFAESQGALLFAAHPYRGDRFTEELLPALAGVEAFNGGNTPRKQAANDRALALVRQRGLPASAGSDAHVASAVGNGARALDLPEGPTLAQFRAALETPGGRVYGHYSPAGPEQRWYIRLQLQRKRPRAAVRHLVKALAGTLLYDPLAPWRPDTRAVARGAYFETGGDGR